MENGREKKFCEKRKSPCLAPEGGGPNKEIPPFLKSDCSLREIVEIKNPVIPWLSPMGGGVNWGKISGKNLTFFVKPQKFFLEPRKPPEFLLIFFLEMAGWEAFFVRSTGHVFRKNTGQPPNQ